MTSRKKKPVNSQEGENGNKKFLKNGKKRLSADTKIILSLMKKHPQTLEELRKNAETGLKTLYERKDLLFKNKLIKVLPDGRWALWDYKEKQKYGASDIVRLIEVLENDKMTQELREHAGTELRRICSWEGMIVGGKNELRPFFLRVLGKPESYEFRVLTDIYIALEYYVVNQLQGEEDIQWMKEKCYPKLVSLFDESGSIKRSRILYVLEQIYRTNELDMDKQNELTQLLRKKFFDPKEDDSIANRCWYILWSCANDELKEMLEYDVSNFLNSWDTFYSGVDDDFKKMLEEVFSNIPPSETEKEIIEKRALEAMKKIIKSSEISEKSSGSRYRITA